MIRVMFVVSALALMSGCVSTENIALPDDALAKDQTHKVIVAERDMPDFSAGTAGSAMFGMLGAANMIATGNNIIEENEVADPAYYIADELIARLSDDYSIEVLTDVSDQVKDESPKKIAELYSDADFVLDVRTINWQFIYFPTDWNNYRVIYSAQLRVIEVATGEVVAQGFHARIPDQDENSPSYEELMENNAERLKAEILLGADEAIEHFYANILAASEQRQQEAERELVPAEQAGT